VWDFRGHGESDYPKDGAQYSEALTVGDMLALLDKVEAKKAIVAGLSLGGYMSLAFNASHSDRVRALMLFDTGPGFKKDEARTKWNETAHKRAADFDARGLTALNSSDEVKLTRHRDATGLAGSARGMLAQEKRSGDPVARQNCRADARAGRRQRHQLPRRHRLHGGQDQGIDQGGQSPTRAMQPTCTSPPFSIRRSRRSSPGCHLDRRYLTLRSGRRRRLEGWLQSCCCHASRRDLRALFSMRF